MTSNDERDPRATAAACLKEAQAIEHKQRALASARGYSDPQVLTLLSRLQSQYEACLLADPAFAEQHNIEHAIWRNHYRRIEDFRSRIRQHASAAPTRAGPTAPDQSDSVKAGKATPRLAADPSRQRGGRGVTPLCLPPGRPAAGQPPPPSPQDLQDLLAKFRSFLLEASGFWHDLISKLRAKYGLPQSFSEWDAVAREADAGSGFFAEDSGLGFFAAERSLPRDHGPGLERGSGGAGREKAGGGAPGRLSSEDVRRCRRSCHLCLIYLGDLARYRELQGASRSKDWSAAAEYYLQAAALLPGSGNPHNQLAVLATYIDDEVQAVYRYFRCLAVADTPFLTARDNLILLFEKNRIRYVRSSSNGEESNSSLRSTMPRFRTAFVRLNGIIFTKTSLETFPSVFSSAMSQLDLLLAAENDTLETAFAPEPAVVQVGGRGGVAGVVLQLVAISIYTVINCGYLPEQRAPSYSEILQKSALYENAFTTLFEVGARLGQRCGTAESPASSFLLPAVLLLLEWLACDVEMATGTDDVKDRQAAARAAFWEATATCLNALAPGRGDETGLEGLLEGPLEGPVDGGAGAGDDEGNVALWEDHELRGFQPLALAQVALDFSMSHPVGWEGREQVRHRVRRVVAAGKAVAARLQGAGVVGLRFDEAGEVFLVGEGSGAEGEVDIEEMEEKAGEGEGRQVQGESPREKSVVEVSREAVGVHDVRVAGAVLSARVDPSTEPHIRGHGQAKSGWARAAAGEDEDDVIVFKPEQRPAPATHRAVLRPEELPAGLRPAPGWNSVAPLSALSSAERNGSGSGRVVSNDLPARAAPGRGSQLVPQAVNGGEFGAVPTEGSRGDAANVSAGLDSLHLPNLTDWIGHPRAPHPDGPAGKNKRASSSSHAAVSFLGAIDGSLGAVFDVPVQAAIAGSRTGASELTGYLPGELSSDGPQVSAGLHQGMVAEVGQMRPGLLEGTPAEKAAELASRFWTSSAAESSLFATGKGGGVTAGSSGPVLGSGAISRVGQMGGGAAMDGTGPMGGLGSMDGLGPTGVSGAGGTGIIGQKWAPSSTTVAGHWETAGATHGPSDGQGAAHGQLDGRLPLASNGMVGTDGFGHTSFGNAAGQGGAFGSLFAATMPTSQPLDVAGNGRSGLWPSGATSGRLGETGAVSTGPVSLTGDIPKGGSRIEWVEVGGMRRPLVIPVPMAASYSMAPPPPPPFESHLFAAPTSFPPSRVSAPPPPGMRVPTPPLPSAGLVRGPAPSTAQAGPQLPRTGAALPTTGLAYSSAGGSTRIPTPSLAGTGLATQPLPSISYGPIDWGHTTTGPPPSRRVLSPPPGFAGPKRPAESSGGWGLGMESEDTQHLEDYGWLDEYTHAKTGPVSAVVGGGSDMFATPGGLASRGQSIWAPTSTGLSSTTSPLPFPVPSEGSQAAQRYRTSNPFVP